MGAVPSPSTQAEQTELDSIIKLARKDMELFEKDLITSQHQLSISKMLRKNELINGFVENGTGSTANQLKSVINKFSQNISDAIVDSIAFIADNVMGSGRAEESTRKFYSTFKQGNGYFRLDIFFTTKNTRGMKYAKSAVQSILGTYYCLSALNIDSLLDNERICIEELALPKQKEAPIQFKQRQIQNNTNEVAQKSTNAIKKNQKRYKNQAQDYNKYKQNKENNQKIIIEKIIIKKINRISLIMCDIKRFEIRQMIKASLYKKYILFINCLSYKMSPYLHQKALYSSPVLELYQQGNVIRQINSECL